MGVFCASYYDEVAPENIAIFKGKVEAQGYYVFALPQRVLDRGVKVMGVDAIGFDPPVAKMFERKKFWEAHRVMRERE